MYRWRAGQWLARPGGATQAKVFTAKSTKDVAQQLERQFNEWLAAEPTAKPVIVEKLTHPTFGWGQVIVSVWYVEG